MEYSREMVDMEAVLVKSPLLLSSSNSVGNCLLNNKTGAPMMFAYSKLSTNQNCSYYSDWSAQAGDSIRTRSFLRARQKIS